MWNKIKKHFEKYPAQLKVAKLIFERGFQVREDGKITSDSQAPNLSAYTET